jgi:hypothetical protein
MAVLTTITMKVTHPHYPTNCAEGSKHEILDSYSNGFDIRIKKEKTDTVMPYIQIFIPRTKCDINQVVV